MPAQLLTFRSRDPIEPRWSSSSMTPLAEWVSSGTARVLNLGEERGVFRERLWDDQNVREFFRILSEKKVLFLLQKEDGDLQWTDTAYVLTYDETDEPRKLHMTVRELYEYVASDPRREEDYYRFFLEYARRNGYILESEDEDESDFEDMDYWRLSEVTYFHPESIRMVEKGDDGYEYSIIHGVGELQIPAMNFISTDTYTPPLLYLLIDAIHHIENIAEWSDAVSVVKYGSGKTRSVTITTTFWELCGYVDALIVRHYILLSQKYDTPEKRRRYIHERFVKPAYDPDLLGGALIVPDEDDE